MPKPETLALLNGVHDLRQDVVGRSVIIDVQRLLDFERQLGALFLEFETFFIECPAEAVDHHWYYYRPVLLDDVCRAFASFGERFGGALREGDDPAI